MTEIVTPVINLNGTAAEELLEQYQLAQLALGVALRKLEQASPHGRDYQTLEPGMFLRAQRQHCERMEALKRVKDQLEVLSKSTAEQTAAREASKTTTKWHDIILTG
jgi:hypothetical protein